MSKRRSSSPFLVDIFSSTLFSTKERIPIAEPKCLFPYWEILTPVSSKSCFASWKGLSFTTSHVLSTFWKYPYSGPISEMLFHQSVFNTAKFPSSRGINGKSHLLYSLFRKAMDQKCNSNSVHCHCKGMSLCTALLRINYFSVCKQWNVFSVCICQ